MLFRARPIIGTSAMATRCYGLRSYCIFCDQEYRAIVKHVSTRWLSLEIAVQRALKQFPSLTSYFKSECESQARFKRLQRAFNDPMTEVYLLFLQSTLPCFTHCNQFLQREEPLVHVLQPQLAKMLQSILGKCQTSCTCKKPEGWWIVYS